jgi:GTP-binding protein
MLKALEKAAGGPAFAISAPLGEGIEPLLDAVIERLGQAAVESLPEEEEPEQTWSPL